MKIKKVHIAIIVAFLLLIVLPVCGLFLAWKKPITKVEVPKTEFTGEILGITGNISSIDKEALTLTIEIPEASDSTYQIILSPTTDIVQVRFKDGTQTKSLTFDDLKIGDLIYVNSLEDIRGKKIINKVERIEVIIFPKS